MKTLVFQLAAVVVCFAAAAPSAAAEKFMFRALVDGHWLEGQPLTWDTETMVMLARDGQVHTFDTRDVKQAKRTSPKFSGFSVGELRKQLRAEFGGRFDIAATQNYMVVHPQGRGKEWANRFEQLYRDFRRWVRVRGFSPGEPPYPLVAVVLPSRAEYREYVADSGRSLPYETVGHYDPVTNRVWLYDDGQRGDEWEETAATVIHEATHQTAYNVGVHTRLADSPVWLVEGLATLFEARGVYRAEAGDSIADRLNTGRLADFRRFEAVRPDGQLQNLIAGDTLFRANADAAYAESWALTLYLSETRARDYADYLLRTSRRKMGETYSASARLADFRAAFGSNLQLLEANFLQWMSELP